MPLIASPVRACGGVIAFAAIAFGAIVSVADELNARLFAAHALAFREAGAAASAASTGVLTGVPGMARVSEQQTSVLWVAFFENAIVSLGRLHSDAPVALYYNPLLDLALMSVWKRSGEGYGVATVRAMLGDELAPSGMPSWTIAPEAPVEALARQTATRLADFRRLHPLDAAEGGYDSTTFAAAAKGGRAVAKRLYVNSVQRSQWLDGTLPWLEPVLAAVENALAAAHPAALLKFAPETDAVTADSLAELPPGFSSGLTLDMALVTEGHGRLLVASRPEDGDIYLLAFCRMGDAGEQSDTCSLRRFVLLSLLE